MYTFAVSTVSVQVINTVHYDGNRAYFWANMEAHSSSNMHCIIINIMTSRVASQTMHANNNNHNRWGTVCVLLESASEDRRSWWANPKMCNIKICNIHVWIMIGFVKLLWRRVKMCACWIPLQSNTISK